MNRSAAGKLALCRWLKAQVSRWEDEAAAELGMLPGDRSTVMIGDTEVGSVTFARGSRSASVVDEHAFLEWVAEHAPSEVETIRRVRPAYRSKLLAQVKDHGALLDADGVVYDDGIVEVSTGEPHPMYKSTDAAGEVFAALLRAGSIAPLLALETQEGEGDTGG